jgi:hypothetical protein
MKSEECLKKKMFGYKVGYTVAGIVNLEKKIGSDSVFGTIYLTSMPYLLGTYPIASKVMVVSQNNESETKMNEWITERLIVKKQTKHFVMMYKSTKCSHQNRKVNNLLKNEQLVNYNELCNGDLSSLMKTDDRNDEMLMINMAYQVIIAIATYQHRVGYRHHDCHHGNILYQLNTESGYYHYIYNGLDFYIMSCKYNMCIFDFGMSEPMSKTDNGFGDYSRILPSFVSHQTYGDIQGVVKANVNANMFMIMTRVQRIIDKLLKTAKSAKTDIFQEIIDNVFKTFKPENNVFTTNKPTNILNMIPFIINKVEEYPNIVFKQI